MKFICPFLSVLAITFITIGQAFANNPCIPNKLGVDVCKLAREQADDMAGSLPMRLNQNVTLDRAYAIGDKLTVIAVLGYDKKYLDEVLMSSGATYEQLKEKLVNVTKANVCQNKSVVKFLEYGGKLGYGYNFSDFMPFYTFEITSCKQ